MTAPHLPIVSRLFPLMAIACFALPACSGSPTPQTVVSPVPSPDAVTASPSPQVVTLPATTGTVEAPPAAATPPSASSPLLVTPPTTNCPVSMAIVADPESPLNVRSSPNTETDNIVGQLADQTFVTVSGEEEGWFEIDTPLTGWIAKSRTQYSCAVVDEAIALSPSQPQALVQGKMIGTGSHQYRINLAAGQTLTIKNEADVFPLFLAPDQQSLNEDIAGTDAPEWSISVPIAGEYILQLDSNFRGFSYQFLITIQN